MEVAVEQRAPVVRCYKCGSSQVSALRHHCWRTGCANTSRLPRGGRRSCSAAKAAVRACRMSGPSIAATALTPELELPGLQAAGLR